LAGKGKGFAVFEGIRKYVEEVKTYKKRSLPYSFQNLSGKEKYIPFREHPLQSG